MVDVLVSLPAIELSIFSILDGSLSYTAIAAGACALLFNMFQ